MQSKNFYIGFWQDKDSLKTKRGIIFYDHREFANIWRQHKEWKKVDDGKYWVLNRAELAINLGLPPAPYFESPEKILEYLETFLASKVSLPNQKTAIS